MQMSVYDETNMVQGMIGSTEEYVVRLSLSSTHVSHNKDGTVFKIQLLLS